MKITRNTPEQLILSDTPWLIGIMLVFFILVFAGAGLGMLSQGGDLILPGLVFALVGGGMGALAFCLFVRRVQVILDRPGGSVVIRRQSVFGYSKVEHHLADLSHAEVESTTSRREGRTRTLHRPVLVLDGGMSAGRHPVVEAYTNGRGAQHLAEAINAWLPASEQMQEHSQ
ncbi:MULTISPECIES: hypothetical protein [unclassified Leisingera]|uniref:hypothetical protein n=1 Tax=unclassified Leisingera TaxID=2614906 RepID=UPI0002F7EE47|nr:MULTISPECIES: hypothetical protein [unclassified Leisingera]KIC21782.1 hypothetical protein RA23_20585 [Leisingera sp. ANG-S3]KIC32586.1 hypothetical protein RA25_08620 [Leisingera sp. ANG-S5]KIC51532.1 hypothetical protein RA22_18955 [Leisingera sp. ANG-S]KID07857.1 hypothetical protein GC1_17755 [Leisingera sp. ANG1]